jgi:hypothetical protein
MWGLGRDADVAAAQVLELRPDQKSSTNCCCTLVAKQVMRVAKLYRNKLPIISLLHTPSYSSASLAL